MGGDSSLAMLGGQQLGSPLVAPGRPRVGPSRSHGHSNSSTGSLFDGMMGPNGGGGPNGGNGGGGGGGNDEYDDDSDDAVTNPLGLHLPNAKQYAALPIFPLLKGNPVVLIVATFLDEVAVEESELLFFESVGAVLYSSLLTQQARAVDRAQLSLIRGLQHEFRTPLHGILGIVDAIQSHEEHGDPLITSDPALFHNLLESIRLASSSLNGLLDDVLTFGEIAGVQTSAKQASKNAKASAVDDIDLGDLIEEVALEELYVRKLSINQSETIRNATSNSDSGSSHGDHDDEGGGSAAIASSSSAAAAAVEPARMADLQLQNGIASLSLSAPSDDEAAATAPAVAQDMHRNASAGAQSNGTSGEASDEAGEGEGEDGTCARTVRQGSSSRTSIRDREPDLPPELVMDTLDLQDRFRCDRTKVQKALRKIVNNALRFTSRGVVKITARQRAEANRNKQVVVDFEISDTGPGMSQEFITNKLMEPFVKGSAFDSGVGLGNVIAASLVSQMGGSMHVASELGKGTTVTISLPLTPLGPNRMMMHQGGYACHAVLFVGCENVGINAGVEFLRSMLRSKGVLPVEEIGGLPDLLVISERVLNATYNKESWEGSGLDQSDKKALLFLQPNARVIVVSRGERGMDRINLGPMGARPIHVLMMPYGPSMLRALHAFLQVQQEKPFALRPLVIPGGGGGAVGGGSLSPSSAVGKKATRPAVRPGMAARRGEALSKRSESAGAGGEEGGGVSSAVDDGAPAQTEASDVSEGEMKAAAEEAVAAAAAVAEGEEAENTGEPQPRPSAGLTRSESEDKTRLAEEVVHQMAQAAAKKADDDEFRVLVVEDNPINLKLLTTLCRRLKFKYEEAKDGVEAVVKYISFRPSVVLLDISLPEQDGFEAAAQMRSHPPFSEHHPRIVAITALSSEQDKIRGLTQCGMDVWLTKPVSTRALHKDLVEMEQVWRAARAGDGGVGQQGQGQPQEQPQQQGQEQPQQ
ncbi:hypothetical protein CF336_g7079 [Tilletia laevis]|nr:hypothetical protein CF336_g7079 [Tilletia laevis]KAE8187888.1 hypothetical protein CF335_g7041 [Tilletia laevis]